MKILAASFIFIFATQLSWAKPWRGEIPNGFENRETWRSLIEDLRKNRLNYSVIAGSERMLNFFEDQPTRQFVYENIIEIVDEGYPFSLMRLFMPSQTSVTDEPYSSSFNTYKAIISLQRKMSRWASAYLEKVDTEKFPKYIFFKATTAYAQGKVSQSIELYQSLLADPESEAPPSLLKKTARNLARIYYSQKKYAEAKDIYENFLLKINPIAPDDWLEAAWVEYRLENYEKALGHLYNLQSRTADGPVNLEQYVIRPLIYVLKCDVKSVKGLIKDFNKKFLSTVKEIKLGRAFKDESVWRRIRHPKTAAYLHLWQTIEKLESELKSVEELDSDKHQDLARRLIKSEIAKLKAKTRMYREATLQHLSRELVNVYEGLRFLRFQVVREKYSPERVFLEAGAKGEFSETDENFKINWAQFGDYWRDEREHMQARLEDKCLIE